MLIKIELAEVPIEEHIADRVLDVGMGRVLVSTIPVHHVRELELSWQRSRALAERTLRNHAENYGRVAE